jgi:hypothetical protein
MSAKPKTPLTEYLAATLLGMIGGCAIVFVLWVVLLLAGGVLKFPS